MEPRETAELIHKVIMIKINKSYNIKPVYEAVRSSWKINLKIAKEADYVLAIYNGIIVGVFQDMVWSQHPVNLDRKEFIANEAPQNILDLYVDKYVPEKYRIRGTILYNYDVIKKGEVQPCVLRPN
jgi:hypothetical protein